MKIVSFTALDAPVTEYLHEPHDRLVAHKRRPAVLICAGGAYQWLSPRELDPPAMLFMEQGYQVFLIQYSTGAGAGGLRPLREAARAVETIREHAQEWDVEENHLAVMGFSAGGHLAASLGILWNHREVALGEKARPDALILAYPVISAGTYAHKGSIETVTAGVEKGTELLSLEKQVNAGMPPTFVWHCVGDESVPVENTMLLTAAMQREGVPFECHLFAGGAHGVSVCNEEVETPYPLIRPWCGLCISWLNNLFSFVP